MTFDYVRLMDALYDLGVQRIADSNYGDYVSVPLGFRQAITITPPSDEREKTYLVEYSTWDETFASSETHIAETDDLDAAVEHVKQAYAKEVRRMAAEDDAWSGYLGSA